jgi:uncharacterized YccA/Bax inhibitor family protein
MALGRTANPALNKNTFRDLAAAGETAMTIQGTATKTMILLLLLVLSASWTWKNTLGAEGFSGVRLWIGGGAFGGLALALITIFKKSWAPVTAPLYALVEGLFIGAISALFEAMYPGIVMQAAMLTFGILFALLLAYKSRLIPVTANFRLGIAAATGGSALIYLVNFVLGFFGIDIPFIHESGPIGIGFSIVVVVVASLNLVLDFDFIENGADRGAPKYMEWYGAFGLLVTLVWLYIEILRLLAKLRSRR